MQGSTSYNLGFAAAICVVCAIVVSSSAVSLKDRQGTNAALDMHRNVLVAAGLAAEDEELSAEETEERFARIRRVVINLETGGEAPDIDPATFDYRRAAADPATSRRAPENPSLVQRLANHAVVYRVENEAGALETLVLPVEGYGLWGTLHGFLALDADLTTIKGLTFYEHKETPGLGGEVDNPRWKALWKGRRAFDDQLNPEITVIKGSAGPPSQDPYRVDGLSGATMTSRGVTNLLHFWLGENGFGPYLERLRQKGDIT
jgi:Na+-transporting NADH:ubiquinone oxidoreductase subunit C